MQSRVLLFFSLIGLCVSLPLPPLLSATSFTSTPPTVPIVATYSYPDYPIIADYDVTKEIFKTPNQNPDIREGPRQEPENLKLLGSRVKIGDKNRIEGMWENNWEYLRLKKNRVGTQPYTTEQLAKFKRIEQNLQQKEEPKPTIPTQRVSATLKKEPEVKNEQPKPNPIQNVPRPAIEQTEVKKEQPKTAPSVQKQPQNNLIITQRIPTPSVNIQKPFKPNYDRNPPAFAQKIETTNSDQKENTSAVKQSSVTNSGQKKPSTKPLDSTSKPADSVPKTGKASSSSQKQPQKGSIYNIDVPSLEQELLGSEAHSSKQKTGPQQPKSLVFFSLVAFIMLLLLFFLIGYLSDKVCPADSRVTIHAEHGYEHEEDQHGVLGVGSSGGVSTQVDTNSHLEARDRPTPFQVIQNSQQGQKSKQPPVEMAELIG